MAHPYTSTVSGLSNAIRQLRSNFPGQVDASTLKKWSIASNNEGVVLVVLRFLGLIDESGRKQPEPAKAFLAHDDEEFASRFAPIVQAAYNELFETWGDAAWALDRDKLISFFRTTDETSARVGLQQALTFQALASFAGHGPAPVEPKASPAPAKKAASKPRARVAERPSKEFAENEKTETPAPAPDGLGRVGLSVRIEINLPVADRQEVYDNIFRSIRENLLNEPSIS